MSRKAALRLARRRKADGGSLDWSGVGDAMPESYGASSPIMDPIANAAISAVNAAKLPGDVYAGKIDPLSNEGIDRTADLAGMTTLGAGAMPAEANALRMGIKAYHGSPHDFDAFDLSKIGTGEGAQAYGHGLYFAENEGTAKAYRDALAGKSMQLPDGTRVTPQEGVDLIKDHVTEAYPDFGQPTQVSQWIFNKLHAGKTAPDIEKDIRGMAWEDNQKDAARTALKAVNGWKTDPKMYEVNINADPEHFLDWDKPLYQQPAYDKIRAHADQIKSMGLQDAYKDFLDAAEMRGMHGSDFVNIAQKSGREALTADLKDAGIPGIKYLDQGSRAAGEGSHNYVVFDDSLINILRKYGLAGLPAAGVAASQYNGDEHMKRGGAARRALKVAKANGGPVFEGYIPGATGGRTDNKDISVTSGSYVIPADILSGLGEGNSHAGWATIAKHYELDKPHKADGGATDAVPIVAASGEAVIPPDAIIAKHGSLDEGHKILDALVKHVRAKTIKKLKSLPSPKKN